MPLASLTELPAHERKCLRPLFATCPGLHGLLDAILDGGMGRAYGDDAAKPSAALLELDFWLIGGDPSSAAAAQIVRAPRPPAQLAVSSLAWEALLRDAWGDRLLRRTRTALRPGRWERDALRRLEALPEGFTLTRVTADSVARFAELEPSLVHNFPSKARFVEQGVGFGVEHEGRFVSGCASCGISSRSLEIEIQTHPDFRRRGFAAAAAAAMIEHCLDRRLEPCWDAHNEASLALALKLGFRDPAFYTAYELRASEAHR